MGIIKLNKCRRGDIIFTKNTDNDQIGHYCLVLNDSYESCSDFGGHGKMYQVMKISTKKPNEYAIPIAVTKKISYLICQNIYSLHENDMYHYKHIGFINDSSFIDMVMDLYLMGVKHDLSASQIQDVHSKYAKYIQECEADNQELLPSRNDFEGNKLLESAQRPTKPTESYILHADMVRSKTDLTIPKDINSNQLRRAVNMAENIITSPSIKKRSYKRMVKSWTDFELILFYLLYSNNRDAASKVYALVDNSMYYKNKSVVKEMISRGLICESGV